MKPIKLLKKELLKQKIDFALFLTDENTDPNLFYLTGYKDSGFLIVPASKEAFLCVPDRDESSAKKIKGLEIITGYNSLFEIIKNKEIGANKIGIVFDNLSVRRFHKLKDKFKSSFIDLTDFMAKMRAVKSLDEIRNIRKACEITDEIFKKFVLSFKKFKTEMEAAAFLVYEARIRGCGLAFEPIVASGKNAAIPHHMPSDKINKGFCVVDFGVNYKGYCSDVTRTFFVGNPSEEDKKLYYKLLKIQNDSIEKVKKGFKIGLLDKGVRDLLGEKFIHSLGHGLGIEVHEAPNIFYSSGEKFVKNMVVTIEPGVYVLGKYGIRIEDDVLVTSGKPKVLSKFRKEFISFN